MQLVIGLALVGLLVGAGWALLSKARPAAVVLAIIGAVVFLALAITNWNHRQRYSRILSAERRIELETVNNRDVTLKIDVLPDVPGFQVRAIPKTGPAIPMEDLLKCNWRARDAAGPVGIAPDSHAGILVNTEREEGFGEGERTWVELTYQVDNETRPILESISLQVSCPWTTATDFDAVKAVHGVLAILWAVAAMIGLAAVGVQVARSRRQRTGVTGLVSP